MNLHSRYFVYVGTVRGVLAYTSCSSDTATQYELEDIEKSEITALEWGRTNDEIIIGYKNGTVQLYDALQNKYIKRLNNLQGNGAVVGIGNTDDCIVIGRHSGVINTWNKTSTDKILLNLEEENTIECMVQNKYRTNIIGTGGERNDFKLWDLETKTCTFKAKSMGHDELNLPIPTSVKGISFLSNENLASCVTKEGYVLLYDEKAQRRPVTKFVEPKASYSAIAFAHKEKQCVVGTTKGYIQLIDLRSPTKCLKTYKSFTGGVTSLQCDLSMPVIISTSLDRHLRVHNLDTKELLYKKYLKQSLTKVIIKPIIKEELNNEENHFGEQEIDEEYETIFENMETVEDVPKKKKRTRSSIEKINPLHRKKNKKIKAS